MHRVHASSSGSCIWARPSRDHSRQTQSVDAARSSNSFKSRIPAKGSVDRGAYVDASNLDTELEQPWQEIVDIAESLSLRIKALRNLIAFVGQRPAGEAGARI